MGCWNGTDFLTNLPIFYGDDVRVFILKNKTEVRGAGVCHIDEILRPIGLPIKAKYNDYGSVDDIIIDWNSEFILAKLKSELGPEIKYDMDDHKTNYEYDLEDIFRGIERSNCRKILRGSFDGEDFKELPLCFVMIHESTYQQILTYMYDYKSWYYDVTIKEHIKSKHEEFVNRFKSEEFALGLEFPFTSNSDIRLGYCTDYNKYLMDNINDSDKILTELIDFDLLSTFMAYTRKVWMIQSGAGSQDDGLEQHKVLGKIILDYCDKNLEHDED